MLLIKLIGPAGGSSKRRLPEGRHQRAASNEENRGDRPPVM